MEKRREDIIRELKIVRESGENLQKKYDEIEKETSKELELLSVVIGNLINKEEQLVAELERLEKFKFEDISNAEETNNILNFFYKIFDIERRQEDGDFEELMKDIKIAVEFGNSLNEYNNDDFKIIVFCKKKLQNILAFIDFMVIGWIIPESQNEIDILIKLTDILSEYKNFIENHL